MGENSTGIYIYQERPLGFPVPWDFRVGIAAAVLAGLAISVFVGQFAVRKIALYRFYAQVAAYDRKPRSLASEQGANQAIEALYRLYDSVLESMPGFRWRKFNPEGKFGKFYTRDDLETIDRYLRPRKEALMRRYARGCPEGRNPLRPQN